jgi:hypothetical protein
VRIPKVIDYLKRPWRWRCRSKHKRMHRILKVTLIVNEIRMDIKEQPLILLLKLISNEKLKFLLISDI